MFKPNNNNPYDCSKKAKITLRKSLLFKTDPKNKENIKDRKDMLCSTPIVKGHSNNPFPSDISSINSFDNETENLVNDYQNGQFEAVVHEPHRLSSPSQIRQNRKKIKCRKSCNNSLSHTICDKTNLAIDNVNPKTYKSDTYDNSNPLAMDDINNSSDLKDTPKLLRGKTKGGKLMSVVNKLLNSALSKNEPTTKNKQSVQRTINFNCSSTTPVNDFTLYKTLYSHNEIKKRECPWESEVQDLLLLDKMENTQRMFPRPTTAHEHFPDVTSLGKSNRSRASLVIEEIRAVKSAETVPIEDEENSQIHSEDKIIQFGQSIMPMGQTENEVVAKIVNSNDLFKTRTQTKKYSYNKLSEGNNVLS